MRPWKSPTKPYGSTLAPSKSGEGERTLDKDILEEDREYLGIKAALRKELKLRPARGESARRARREPR